MLRRQILQAASGDDSGDSETASEQRIRGAVTPVGWEINTEFSARDLVVGGAAHRRALESTLRNARSWIVIHSTFLSADRFREWVPMLSEAVGRGARIDILWGMSPDGQGPGVISPEVAACRNALGGDDVLRHNVKLHSFSSRSHAKLLMADNGYGGVVGYLGSCNWLSTGFGSVDISIRSSDPQVVANIAGYLSQLSRNAQWTSVQPHQRPRRISR